MTGERFQNPEGGQSPQERILPDREAIRQKLRDPAYLPTHKDLRVAFPDKASWAEYVSGPADNRIYEVLNTEFIDKLSAYLAHRLNELSRSIQGPIILELGAGNGRLSHFLQMQLQAKFGGNFKIIATDTGAWGKIQPSFPVEKVPSNEDALMRHRPQIVICSWMPAREDWTKDIRQMPSVEEYVLIGEIDGGDCGDPWKTWGACPTERDKITHANQQAPYEADGFTRQKLKKPSNLQIAGADESVTETIHSATVSFRRKMPQYKKPPLGTPPDFLARGRQESEALLTLDYSPLETYPELARTYQITGEDANLQRHNLGLDSVNFDLSHCRLINAEVYDANSLLRKHESGAVYDDLTGTIYIRFSKNQYESSQTESVRLHYVIVHEATHKGMNQNGIADFSQELNEGITELHAKEIFGRKIFPILASQTDQETRNLCIQKNKSSIEGFKIHADDILYVGAGDEAVAYTRIPEMRFVEKIKITDQAAYDLLVKAAYRGQPDEARAIISSRFGSELAESLNDPYGFDLKRLYDKLS